VHPVSLSPGTGKVISIFGTKVLHYNSLADRDDADYFQVFSADPTGRLALVAAPRFARLTSGAFAPIPSGPGPIIAAAWSRR
jgi:hypothetical protein